jgi:hypothetical protein
MSQASITSQYHSKYMSLAMMYAHNSQGTVENCVAQQSAAKLCMPHGPPFKFKSSSSMYVCCNGAGLVSRVKKEDNEEEEEARDQTANDNHL